MPSFYTDMIGFAVSMVAASTIVSVIRRVYVYSPMLLSTGLSVLAIVSTACIVNGVSAYTTLGLPAGSSFSLALTPLNAFFLLIFSIVGIAVAVYSLEYLSHHHRHEDPRHYWLYLSASYLSIALFLLADGFLVFLFSLDAMIIFLGLLIGFDRTYTRARAAARLYIVMGLLASALIIISLSIVYSETGVQRITELEEACSGASAQMLLALVLGITGFSIKAGIAPFHSWLPRAHAEAPAPVSALLSGFVVSTGLYGIMVFTIGLRLYSPLIENLMLVLGVTTAVYGAVMAIAQDDLKSLLAYSTVSHMGYALMIAAALYHSLDQLAGAAAALLMLSMLLYIANHSIAKTTLFLTAGNIVSHIGTRDLNKMGGLAGEMKPDYIIAVAASIALIGLPPGTGFAAKTLYHMIMASLGLRNIVLDTSVAALLTILTASYLLKVIYRAFIHEAPHTEYYKIIGRHGEKIPDLMTYPGFFLLSILALIGAMPQLIESLAASIAPQVGVSPGLARGSLLAAPYTAVYAPATAGFMEGLTTVLLATAATPASVLAGFWLWTHIELLSYEIHKIADTLYHAYLLKYSRKTLHHIVARLEVIEDNYWLTLTTSLALLALLLAILLR